ncbi:class 1b ribonucleoside-diphosphate reductase subunit beta [Paenibacillus alvei]|uniref:class 1b ribonucleoside-diphosphate reductase subunit beta n=1 Tax=Paenibacillus alvei TaxID=44250 RepID=UPI00227E0D9B|nr:class 1b ribonucleoside-diphosphate reductase subunit beta [Paenibacillus alvei]MCY9737530.1 class 1b ribonucleoside-diphosphate reductase subunit beta [Paenibacillus alvei]
MTRKKAVNWNTPTDDYTLMFFDQNTRQFWLDAEIPVSKDLKVWRGMSQEQQETYKQVLAGLTLLDTLQSKSGMIEILRKVEDPQRSGVLTFMASMEVIHAKSYSTIFTTLCEKKEIDDLFEWIERNRYLQYKAQLIDYHYQNINDDFDLYMAMAASVFLESFLFYSGFFYPLYLSGQGKMVNSGEIINLIIRDESIHGVYVGKLAQELYDTLSEEQKKIAATAVLQLLDELMENEINYTKEVYGSLDLHHDVIDFVKYNANKALMNLGMDTIYEHGDVNPIVLNGLNTETKTHDFFSTKGNGYAVAKVEPLRDEDFIFDNL